MGVDFWTCDKCSETYPDCGDNDRCEKGHGLCPNCMPDVPREWDVDEEDENRVAILARRNDDGELICAECPVCKLGGTSEEKLEREVADLRAKLSAAEAQGEAMREALDRIWGSALDIRGSCVWCHHRMLHPDARHTDDCPATIARRALEGAKGI